MGLFGALLLPVGTLVLRFVPRCFAIALAPIVGDIWGAVSRARRRAVEDNLIRTAHNSQAGERQRLRRATFRNFAVIWVDFLRVPFLRRQALLDLVSWNTHTNLDEALAQRRGVVIVTAHVGALDLAGIYLAARGYRISVIVEDIAPSLYRVWRRYRESTGMRVLSRRNGAVAAYRSLRRGEVVAVVADRVIQGGGLEVPFCGGRRNVPTGPAAFALKATSPIVMLEMTLRRDRTGYDLVTRPGLTPSGSAETLTRAIATDLADLVDRFPDQWFVFEAAWQVDPQQLASAEMCETYDRGAS